MYLFPYLIYISFTVCWVFLCHVIAHSSLIRLLHTFIHIVIVGCLLVSSILERSKGSHQSIFYLESYKLINLSVTRLNCDIYDLICKWKDLGFYNYITKLINKTVRIKKLENLYLH